MSAASRVGAWTHNRRKRSLRLVLITVALPWLACSGCYYGHLAAGQTRLWLAKQSSQALLDDPTTPLTLRAPLELASEVRAFAIELGLDVGGQYTSYVAWPGDRVITTVVATRPGEVEAAGFRFPIVGRVPYKGFFSQERAEAQARTLREDGLDVCVVPVRAYSTLGWFADPLTQPMIAADPLALVETLLHELVHATVFVESEPDFNEGVASFVGEEAAVRFVASRGLPRDPRFPAELEAAQRDRVADGRLVDGEVLALRQRIEALYQRDLEPPLLGLRRQQLELDARGHLAALPLQASDADELAQRARLGDACLALRGTYASDTERYVRALDELDGDLSRFITELRSAAVHEDPRAAFFDARPR